MNKDLTYIQTDKIAHEPYQTTYTTPNNGSPGGSSFKATA